MSPELLLQSLVLGVVEGLTEFLPVSSTGHLILGDRVLGFQGPPGGVFEVAIQLGAILAVCVMYFGRLWEVVKGLPRDPGARRFAVAVILAFLPAALLGVVLHGFIKAVLFTPIVVCAAMIVGGIVILMIERFLPPARVHAIEGFTPRLSVQIGLLQCLALVPGVSRSGATILGAAWLGVDRRTAAEFSFFLAIPTMFGATVYDLYKNWAGLNLDDGLLIAVGFVTAFLSAMLVVGTMIGFIARHGFAPFGWYRIAVGSIGLAALLAMQVA